MPSLTIKRIPEELLEQLRFHAEENRRSLNSEVLQRLEQSVARPSRSQDELVKAIEAFHDANPLPPLTDEFLSKARGEGRP